MSNSPLVTYTGLTLNCNSPRNHIIDWLTIHCFVGQVTAKRGCQVFQNGGSSCNYIVGCDGGIGLSVEERNRSWCTSSRMNDNRAITIEVASDNFKPYAVKNEAYSALLDLITDICVRNGKTKLLWFADKDKTLSYSPKKYEMVITVHKWFANKECPGKYLYDRLPDICREVNSRLDQNIYITEKGVVEMVITKEELEIMIKKAVVEVYNEINPFYKDIDDVPDYWKDTVQKLLDSDSVNGGTSTDVDDKDVNIRLETLKAAIIAAKYTNYTVNNK